MELASVTLDKKGIKVELAERDIPENFAGYITKVYGHYLGNSQVRADIIGSVPLHGVGTKHEFGIFADPRQTSNPDFVIKDHTSEHYSNGRGTFKIEGIEYTILLNRASKENLTGLYETLKKDVI